MGRKGEVWEGRVAYWKQESNIGGRKGRWKGGREVGGKYEGGNGCRMQGKGGAGGKEEGEWVRCSRLEVVNEEACDDIRIRESQWKAIGK